MLQNFKFKPILLFLYLASLFYSASHASPTAHPTANPIEKPPLVLGQGEQRFLRIPGLEKYSLSGTGVRVLSSHLIPKDALLLKGVAPGVSDLWVWKTDGTMESRTLRVEMKLKHDPLSLLERALGKLNETEVIFSGQRVVIRGEIRSFTEAAYLAAILRAFPAEVYDETTPSESLLEIADGKLKHWLKTMQSGISLRVERIGQSLWLRGHVENHREVAGLEKQAKTLFPLIKIEIESLPDSAPTVHFRVFLLELKRTHFRSFGLSWPSSFPASFQINPTSLHGLAHIDLALQQLEGHGDAKVLSNPELVVRAPGEAELFAGGELPIQARSRNYSKVTWKNYGLTLRLKVTHCAGDRVRLDIYTEVSHLKSPQTVDQVPGIQANRMKTQVDAQFGVPLFLSGLLQQGIREEAKGLPFLKNIPVLGLLFGSEDYLNERSELVAILYPHATPPPISNESRNRIIPKGPSPIPRNWVNPKEEEFLRGAKDYPWNVL